MKKEFITKVAENILVATKHCDINTEQTKREKILLEIGIGEIWEKTPYNANTNHLHYEIARELSDEIDLLIAASPDILPIAVNCNLRLQEFNQKFSRTDFTDFNKLSKVAFEVCLLR